METERTYTAFLGERMLASGPLREMLRETKKRTEKSGEEGLLIFADDSGQQVEFDLRGSVDEVLEREAPSPRSGPGRPRLGVQSREVSLLPRHWEWLDAQPSGISAALRRLVEEAMKREPEKERARRRRDAAGRIMTVMAGNLPNYEEAARALYQGDQARFERLIRGFPRDVQKHLKHLTRGSAEPGDAEGGASQ